LEKPQAKVVTTLAQGLTSPEDGNLEFQAFSVDGSVKSLFAHRSVLTFKSDVFKQGDHPPHQIPHSLTWKNLNLASRKALIPSLSFPTNALDE